MLIPIQAVVPEALAFSAFSAWRTYYSCLSPLLAIRPNGSNLCNRNTAGYGGGGVGGEDTVSIKHYNWLKMFIEDFWSIVLFSYWLLSSNFSVQNVLTVNHTKNKKDVMEHVLSLFNPNCKIVKRNVSLRHRLFLIERWAQNNCWHPYPILCGHGAAYTYIYNIYVYTVCIVYTV